MVPDPFTITVDSTKLARDQQTLIATAQLLLGKPSEGAPAYVFGGEAAQYGAVPLPRLLIDAGDAGFQVMQPSANHIDLPRCAEDQAYAQWVQDVFAAAGIPLLSASVHMTSYNLLSATHHVRALAIIGEPDSLLQPAKLEELLLWRMAMTMIGAARLGIQALHLFWGLPGDQSPYNWPFGQQPAEMRKRFVAVMMRLLPLVEKLKLRLCHEIHFGTVALNADDYIQAWNECGKSPYMCLGFDPSHFWHGESWIIALDKLRAAGIKVALCHFKQAITIPGRPMLGYEIDDRLRGMMFGCLDSPGIVDMNLYAGQLTLPGTGLVEFWHGECDLPIPGYAEAEDPHWRVWDVLVRGVAFLQRILGSMHLAKGHFTDQMATKAPE